MAYIGRDIQYGTLDKQSFTPNGSTTAFSLNSSVLNAKSLLVGVGGVVQEPEVAYTASGTTLTFTEAPLAGNSVYAVYLGKTLEVSEGRNSISYQTGTGDGTTTPLTLSDSPANAQSIIVSLDGIMQTPVTNYNVSGTTLTFVTAPETGIKILVYHMSQTAVIGTIADSSITNVKISSMDASKLTGSLPSNLAVDTTSIDHSIATLGLHVATSDNKVAFNLPGIFIDQFESDSGILTETTVDRNTTSEYVSSIVDPSVTTIPTSSSDWNGVSGIGAYDYTSGGIDANSGDRAVYTDWETGTGDFEIEFTLTGYDYGGNIGVFAVSEVSTFDSTISRGGLHNMTNSWYHREYNQTYYKSSTTLPSVTIANGSVVKIQRVSGTLSLVDDGVTAYTWSGTNNDSLHFFVGSDGAPYSIDIDNLTLKVGGASTVNATGTLISTASTADAATTTASGVMVYENSSGTATLGTDLKAYFSADDGANWTEASSYGSPLTFSGQKKMVKLGKTTGLTSGTQMKLKAEWANQSAGPVLSGTKFNVTAGMLSGSNLGSFVASEIVDGSKTEPGSQGRGFFVSSGTTNGVMTLDFGNGNAQTLGKISVWCAIATSAAVWAIQYSDNNSSWTNTTLTNFAPGASAFSQSGGQGDFIGTWDNVGAHRYWRMTMVSGNGGSQGWVGDEIEWYAFESTGAAKETRLHGWALNY